MHDLITTEVASFWGVLFLGCHKIAESLAEGGDHAQEKTESPLKESCKAKSERDLRSDVSPGLPVAAGFVISEPVDSGLSRLESTLSHG